MATATRSLAQQMDYDVPLQDLRLSRRKVPALPTSGFVITNVRAVLRPEDDADAVPGHASSAVRDASG